MSNQDLTRRSRFRGKIIQGWQGEITGEALVTKSKVSFLGDVDMKTGMVVGKDIDIFGQNMTGRVLVFPESRGSTVGSNVLYGLAVGGHAPKLIITLRAEPVTISGAIFGSIPMVTEVSDEIFASLRTGDRVRSRVEGKEALLEVIS